MKLSSQAEPLIKQEEKITEGTNLYIEFHYQPLTREVYWFDNFLDSPFGIGKSFLFIREVSI